MTDMFKNSYPALIIVFVVAFLLGYGTSARLVNRQSGGAENKTAGYAANETGKVGEVTDEMESAESSLAQISASVAIGMNTVSANDQPAGSIVAVTVKAGKDIWVAVHEDTGGKPGSILGAQLFTKGTHTGTVDLLRPMMAGRKYYAMLHADDGDHVFDHAKDMPLIASTGGVITDTFTAGDAPAAQ